MSEGQHRPPPRGRGAPRGGRGGNNFAARGGLRGAARTNGESHGLQSTEDQGEVGQLKKQYADKLTMVRELFPDWTDEDIVFALQENHGDIEATVTSISDGRYSQFIDTVICRFPPYILQTS